ncbi:MAG: carbonic anhydrase family protein [Lactobacillaceae bacterium]|jgi:carbonic anhydrase|nr:carbonic anhydrase family protein [Lactobacillaceae bacterium]
MNMKYSIIGAALVVVGVGIGAAGTILTQPQQTNTELTEQQAKAIKEKAAKEGEHLSYADQKDWTFESGDAQSPINIESSDFTDMDAGSNLVFNYDNHFENVVNNGHAIEAEIGGTADIDGRTFNLAQFHFHAESEHTINQKHTPIEAHFVNKSADGRIAVVAVLLKSGDANPAFQTVLDNVGKKKEAELDINELLPTNHSYYHYNGSLTTPPLTENVEWYVLKHQVEVSPAQIKAFHKYYTHNNRDLQALDARTILEYNEN